MKIKKAVITAAGNQRGLPLQMLVDRKGAQKTALQIIVEEALSARVDEICLVVRPGDQSAYRAAAGDHPCQLHFVEQSEPRGYGHALSCAREFVGDEPFLHLIGDHLYLTEDGNARSCAQQIVEVAEAESCAISAVQATRETLISNYGAVAGKRMANKRRLYLIDDVIEKPTPTEAEQRLMVPGLRAGYYLCFFGIHVFTPTVMKLLAERVGRDLAKDAEATDGAKIELSWILAELARQERYMAYEAMGSRYDIGVHYGLLMAQLALALDGDDRAEVLERLVDLLSYRIARRRE
jgi:UTP--glucose-1-phosphate uridylyltransferase